MSTALDAFISTALAAPVPAEVHGIAAALASAPGTVAVLFYGSNLRTGSLDGVLDFYVLTEGPRERGLWPRVGYREFARAGTTLRAKIATMRLATFAAAAGGLSIDTTIWTRFVQPAALVWTRDEAARTAVTGAVAAAAITAARFAAVLGPEAGEAADFWRALFRQTYAAELRVEAAGREEQILQHGAGRYQALLPLAWKAAGIAFTREGERLTLAIDPQERMRWQALWARRRRLGRPLNIVRLVRAAWTFEGAGAYGAWKVERHTGVRVPLTAFRERHPILAAPGVLLRVWRERRR
ncbi:hypothetical protein GCM10011380_05680 [Sphingomonas metalli]|uniref:Uncharacterized protein n=1 Tax=Sphingomonas metalli TaxID=1779358 RepID=A0A916WP19_9SPHN|nr:hypothetical protein [Sphingomonas metalli]GGB18977.1 hypothetical protein GCM10011380_05680 [Sphingomonas metalli]